MEVVKFLAHGWMTSFLDEDHERLNNVSELPQTWHKENFYGISDATMFFFDNSTPAYLSYSALKNAGEKFTLLYQDSDSYPFVIIVIPRDILL